MKNWEKASENLYEKVDNMDVDFYLGVDGDYIDSTVFGITGKPTKTKNGYQYRSADLNDGNDALNVFINSDVNLFSIDEETGEFSLNHEAGHFIFAVESPKEYYEDKNKIIKNKENYKGGHHKDARTGHSAEKHGKNKDIKK